MIYRCIVDYFVKIQYKLHEVNDEELVFSLEKIIRYKHPILKYLYINIIY